MRSPTEKKRIKKVFPSKLLQRYHAELLSIDEDEFLFREGEQALDYYQIEIGCLKMSIVNPLGHEFIMGIYERGESVGEPALIGKFPYEANTRAMEESQVWKLSRQFFFEMLKENFDMHLKIDQVLCQRLKYTSMVLTEISSHSPEHRIYSLLSYFKSKVGTSGDSEKLTIRYTRQQLADMLGLRVETVIRTVKKMEKEGVLQLQGHKIIF